MATIHVDSNAAGANNGTSWPDAYTALSSATGAAAGDLIKIDYRHVDRPAANTTRNFANGTRANPVKLVSVDKDNSDALLAGAVVGTANTNFYTHAITGNLYVHGLTLEAAYTFTLGSLGQFQTYELCVLKPNTYTAGNAGALALVGTSYAPAYLRFLDCSFEPQLGTFRGITIQGTGRYEFIRLAIVGSPGSVTLFPLGINSGIPATAEVVVRDSDLSAFTNLVDVSTQSGILARIQRCKVHASVVPAVGTKHKDIRGVLLEHCDDGTITVPPLGLNQWEPYQGSVKSTLAVYRTGGADDGEQANPYSWQMATNANGLEIFNPLVSWPLTRWIEPDASISGATAKGVFTTTRCGPLATPAALTTDTTSTWNGSGVGTKQKIEHTLTNGSTLTVYVASGGTLNNDDFWIEVHEPDQVGGPLTVVCFLAKPTTTVYVDPQLEVV